MFIKLSELYGLYPGSEIPEALAQLTSLQFLYLSNNQISEIPEALAHLTSLQYLYLLYVRTHQSYLLHIHMILYSPARQSLKVKFSGLSNILWCALTHLFRLECSPVVLDIERTGEVAAGVHRELHLQSADI